MIDDEEQVRKIMLGIEDPTKDSDPTTLKDGDVVGVWRIRALVGSGGFGNVYRVEHVRSGAIAALKILTKFDEESRKRFELETEILQAIHTSKKIARRYFPAYLGTGNHQIGARQVPYVVTEFLEQLRLSDRDEKIGKFVEQMCEAVEELHRNGYLHRDIKTLNVMMRKDEDAESVPILIDFGGAIRIKDAENPDVRTRVSMEYGQIKGFGTIYSSAPEQLYGIATVRSDVYALGALISESFRGNIPENWQRIVQKATEPRPENRYQSVAEMRRAIGRRERQSNWMRFTRIACIIGFISSVVTLSIRFYQGFLKRDASPSASVETSTEKREPKQVDDTPSEAIKSRETIKISAEESASEKTASYDAYVHRGGLAVPKLGNGEVIENAILGSWYVWKMVLEADGGSDRGESGVTWFKESIKDYSIEQYLYISEKQFELQVKGATVIRKNVISSEEAVLEVQVSSDGVNCSVLQRFLVKGTDIWVITGRLSGDLSSKYYDQIARCVYGAHLD